LARKIPTRRQTPKPSLSKKKISKNETVSLGSQEQVYFEADLGFFQTVFEAWTNHWNLRTSPEDWWNPIIIKIAKKIDSAAKKDARVRDFFVDHQGKKEISVESSAFTIYDVDYQIIFDQFSEGIRRNIKVPEYAQCMQCDFGSTTPTQRIASQITLMSSVQEFFEYHMKVAGCGLQGLELLGTEQDWLYLVKKFDELIKLLEPLNSVIDLSSSWILHIKTVFSNLLKTYQEKPEAVHWWKDIIMEGKTWEWGPSGMRKYEVESYNGWLILFLTGLELIKKKDLERGRNIEEFAGLCDVPLKISLTYLKPPIIDEGTLVAGILGFKVHNDAVNLVPSVQAHHAWGLMLKPHSALRIDQREKI